ncbi:unnamed protein product [Meloidogyne enterolobii]|uniref:Uncharacterized protein n=1 Tax=Meloidogyne enterolobii TaxID=390850 RepID=A0ACB1A7N3_MELEN
MLESCSFESYGFVFCLPMCFHLFFFLLFLCFFCVFLSFVVVMFSIAFCGWVLSSKICLVYRC